MKKELNLIPLLCRAVSVNPRCYEIVNKTFTPEAYRAARGSEFYDSPLINFGGIEQDRIARRFLGILLADEDAIIKILRKGYAKVFRFLEGKTSIVLEEYVEENYSENILDDVAVLFFLTIQRHITITDAAYRDMILDDLIGLSSELDRSTESLSRYDFDDVDSFCDSVGNELAVTAADIITSRCFVRTAFPKPSEADKRIIAASYDCAREAKSEETLLTYSYYLLSMCKLYRDVKNEYFSIEPEALEENKKQLESQLAVLDNQCRKLMSENTYLTERCDKLTAQLDDYQSGESSELKDLRKRLEEAETYKTELNALRELAFSLESETEPKADTVPDLTVKALLIGGTESFRKALSDIYPQLRTVPASARVVDRSILSNYDFYIFDTSCINHQLYYYCVDYARTNKVNVIYLNSKNIPKCVEKINTAKSTSVRSELTVKDIADQCNVTIGAIYARMQRLTEKLGRVPTMDELLESALSARTGLPRKY